jgi:hypothetical protein
MVKFREVLNMFESDDSNLKSAFLPIDTELVSAKSLLDELNQKYGEDVGQDFMNLILKQGTVKHRELLIEFFKTKKDLISKQCLQILTKQE